MGVGPPPDPRYMLALRARHVCPPVLTYFDLGRPWLGPLPLRHVRSARCPSRSRHSSFPLSCLFHFIPTHLRHSIQIPTLVAVSESLCFYSQRSLTSVALQTYNDTAAEGKFSVLTLLYCIGDSNEQLALAFQLSQSHGTLSERHAGCCSLLPSGPIGGRTFKKINNQCFRIHTQNKTVVLSSCI